MSVFTDNVTAPVELDSLVVYVNLSLALLCIGFIGSSTMG